MEVKKRKIAFNMLKVLCQYHCHWLKENSGLKEIYKERLFVFSQYLPFEKEKKKRKIIIASTRRKLEVFFVFFSEWGRKVAFYLLQKTVVGGFGTLGFDGVFELTMRPRIGYITRENLLSSWAPS